MLFSPAADVSRWNFIALLISFSTFWRVDPLLVSSYTHQYCTSRRATFWLEMWLFVIFFALLLQLVGNLLMTLFEFSVPFKNPTRPSRKTQRLKIMNPPLCGWTSFVLSLIKINTRLKTGYNARTARRHKKENALHAGQSKLYMALNRCAASFFSCDTCNVWNI